MFHGEIIIIKKKTVSIFRSKKSALSGAMNLLIIVLKPNKKATTHFRCNSRKTIINALLEGAGLFVCLLIFLLLFQDSRLTPFTVAICVLCTPGVTHSYR